MAQLRTGAAGGLLAGVEAGRWEGQDILASSRNEGGAMFDIDKRVFVQHYLEQGVAKVESACWMKIGRRTVYNWIAADGKLEKGACESEFGETVPTVCRGLTVSRGLSMGIENGTLSGVSG